MASARCKRGNPASVFVVGTDSAFPFPIPHSPFPVHRFLLFDAMPGKI
jgi:hypothetical protein